MGSALLNPPAIDPAAFEAPGGPNAPPALRLQAAERLAAHRSRRTQQPIRPAADAPPDPPATRSTRIAASVAERFARSQSYSAFLAAEAERATRQAQAAAEIAARNAQAVALAEQQLLRDLYTEACNQQAREEEAHQPQPLELWPESGLDSAPLQEQTRVEVRPSSRAPRPKLSNREAAPPAQTAESTTAVPVLTVCPFGLPSIPIAAQPASAIARKRTREEDAEARALDDEINFRHAPVFEEPAGPPMPLPTNLIEFPRQLVAPRKARPRHAEGPLRDEEAAAPSESQLRIFEVDTAQISTTPYPVDDPSVRWTSIWLDPAPRATPAESTDSALAQAADTSASVTPYLTGAPQRYPAAVSRRVLAAAIDASLILASFLASAATFAAVALHFAPAATSLKDILGITAESPAKLALLPIVAVSAAALLFFYFAYQLLFFTLSEATPGMRAARIALCTFHDENPTRKSMRRRIFAVLISAVPLGLGFLWATLDDDRLTWHDLISRMYQRSY